MRIDAGGRLMYFDVDGAKLVPDGPAMVERPTILLLHGGPGMDHSVFKPTYGPLTDTAQLLYVDHSGQGRSEPTSPERWDLDTWADDIVRFCDALHVERPVILGWSFGGMVAMNLAGRYPDRLSGLVLQSTAARMDLDRVVEAMKVRGGSEAAAIARTFWTTPSPESMDHYMNVCLPLYSPEPLDTEGMERIVMTPELLTGGWAESLTFDLSANVANIAVPTLVVCGELDPITPPGASAEIVDYMPAGLASHRLFARSGHFINETEPDELFATVREFVKTAL